MSSFNEPSYGSSNLSPKAASEIKPLLLIIIGGLSLIIVLAVIAFSISVGTVMLKRDAELEASSAKFAELKLEPGSQYYEISNVLDDDRHLSLNIRKQADSQLKGNFRVDFNYTTKGRIFPATWKDTASRDEGEALAFYKRDGFFKKDIIEVFLFRESGPTLCCKGRVIINQGYDLVAE